MTEQNFSSRETADDVIATLGVELTTNDDLDLLCGVIELLRPNWDYLMEEMANSPVQKDRVSLHGTLAEVHINKLLDDRAHSDLFKDILEIADLENQETDNYHFEKIRRNLFAKSNQDNKPVAEYDNIIVVNGLPTILEIKAQIDNKGKSGLTKTIKPEKMKHFFPPLKEYFNTDIFGFVVVTLADRIEPSSIIQNTFQNILGGKLIAMNTTSEELKAKTKDIVFAQRGSNIIWSSGAQK